MSYRILRKLQGNELEIKDPIDEISDGADADYDSTSIGSQTRKKININRFDLVSAGDLIRKFGYTSTISQSFAFRTLPKLKFTFSLILFDSNCKGIQEWIPKKFPEEISFETSSDIPLKNLEEILKDFP